MEVPMVWLLFCLWSLCGKMALGRNFEIIHPSNNFTGCPLRKSFDLFPRSRNATFTMNSLSDKTCQFTLKFSHCQDKFDVNYNSDNVFVPIVLSFKSFDILLWATQKGDDAGLIMSYCSLSDGKLRYVNLSAKNESLAFKESYGLMVYIADEKLSFINVQASVDVTSLLSNDLPAGLIDCNSHPCPTAIPNSEDEAAVAQSCKNDTNGNRRCNYYNNQLRIFPNIILGMSSEFILLGKDASMLAVKGDSCEDVMIQKEGKKKTYNFPLLDFYPTTTTTTTTTKNTTRGNITPDPEQSTPSSGNGTGGGDHHSAAFGNVANNIVLFSIAFVVMVAPLLA